MRMSIDEMLARARDRLRRLNAIDAYVAQQRGAWVIDVRTSDQRAVDGEVPAAIPISLNVLEWRLAVDSDARLAHAPRLADEVIVLCHEGYSSSLAAARLHDLGFVRATDVVGGFRAWRAAGLPIGPAWLTAEDLR
jgi:rhodanese-related sulfurtransferase